TVVAFGIPIAIGFGVVGGLPCIGDLVDHGGCGFHGWRRSACYHRCGFGCDDGRRRCDDVLELGLRPGNDLARLARLARFALRPGCLWLLRLLGLLLLLLPGLVLLRLLRALGLLVALAAGLAATTLAAVATASATAAIAAAVTTLV